MVSCHVYQVYHFNFLRDSGVFGVVDSPLQASAKEGYQIMVRGQFIVCTGRLDVVSSNSQIFHGIVQLIPGSTPWKVGVMSTWTL
jgi:hypothetical protein